MSQRNVVVRSSRCTRDLLVQCLLSVFLLASASLSHADAKATIAYLEALLSAGKKVAILYVDMQKGFVQELYYPELYLPVYEEQETVLSHFAGNENIFFVDVNWWPDIAGRTLPGFLDIMKKSYNYRLFLKSKPDAFRDYDARSRTFIPEDIRTHLDVYLDSVGVKDILVCGCFDSGCVLATTAGALERGYNVSFDRSLNITNYVAGTERKEKEDQEWDALRKKYPSLTEIKAEGPVCVVQ